MKTFWGILLAVCLLAPVPFTTGCHSLNQTSYRAVGSAAITADHAMNAWGQYVRDGKATPADEARVKAAYQTYQKAALAVIDAAQAYKASPNDTALKIFNATIAASGAALADLVGLIQQFVPSLK